MGTTNSRVRSRGGRQSASIGIAPSVYYFSFTATAASAALVDGTGGSLTLPSGFVPLSVVFNGAATGGTDPTFDLGTSGTADLFLAEADADGGVATVNAGGATGGTGLGVALSTDTVVYGGVGASAPTGGTVSGRIIGVVHDTGAPI